MNLTGHGAMTLRHAAREASGDGDGGVVALGQGVDLQLVVAVGVEAVVELAVGTLLGVGTQVDAELGHGAPGAVAEAVLTNDADHKVLVGGHALDQVARLPAQALDTLALVAVVAAHVARRAVVGRHLALELELGLLGASPGLAAG